MSCIPRKQRARIWCSRLVMHTLSARAAHLSGERDMLPGSFNEAIFTWEIPAARPRSLLQILGREVENLYVLETHPKSGHPITASIPNVGSPAGPW
jgi:hypothetical protein